MSLRYALLLVALPSCTQFFPESPDPEASATNPVANPYQAAAEAGGEAFADSLEPHCADFEDEAIRFQCVSDVAEARSLQAAAAAMIRTQTEGWCDLQFGADGSYMLVDSFDTATLGVSGAVECSMTLLPEDALQMLAEAAQQQGFRPAGM